MNTKYSSKTDKKMKKYIHSLNGSALAIARTIIAIMENYQNSDGSIAIANVLQKYMSNDTVVSK